MGKVFKMPMRHPDIVNTKRLPEDGFVSTMTNDPCEAASAVSEFGHQEEPQPSPGLWTRMLRAMRAWWIR